MTPTDPSPTAGDPVRTDFIDYPTAWRIVKEGPLEHHPECSFVTTGGAVLCDCAAMAAEWARRAIDQEPEREAEIRDALQRYLPEHTSRWWDTGHTPSGCPDCGHHWDVHTPSRGCSFCSCKNDPPNQPFVEVVTDRWANERHADCDEADCDCDCHQREEA